MANFLAGDITGISVTHLGNTYRYSPKANETFNIDKGGRRTNDDKSKLTSDFQNIRQINAARWSIDGPIAADFVSGNEEDSLNLMAGSPAEGVWQISHISGAIWVGKGSPVGDIQADLNAATITLKIGGAGILQAVK
jgi:hypothetical protein